MQHLPSVLLVGFGLVVLVVLVVRLWRSLVRFGAAQALVHEQVSDRTGMLKARTAALKVAVAERKKNSIRTSSDIQQ